MVREKLESTYSASCRGKQVWRPVYTSCGGIQPDPLGPGAAGTWFFIW